MRRETKFVFTTKDGTEIPALPPPKPVGTGATLGTASEEDQFILMEPVRPW
jgi:hypothetical protein